MGESSIVHGMMTRDAIMALLFGAALACVALYFLPHMSWVEFALVTFFGAAAVYSPLLQQTAAKKIIDRGDWPNK